MSAAQSNPVHIERTETDPRLRELLGPAQETARGLLEAEDALRLVRERYQRTENPEVQGELAAPSGASPESTLQVKGIIKLPQRSPRHPEIRSPPRLGRVKKRDIVALQCENRRSVGKAQLQEDSAGAPCGDARRVHELSDLAALDPTGKEEPLGSIACGPVVVELELLEEHNRRIGTSIDA